MVLTADQQSLAEYLASLSKGEAMEYLLSLPESEAERLLHSWAFWARPEQLAPAGNDWVTWLLLAGRGFGKTRAGAEEIRKLAESGAVHRIAMVAKTPADARDVMIQGESGLIAIASPGMVPKYYPGLRKVLWPNGVYALVYSSWDPDTLRGPQFDFAWCDEVASWRYVNDTWDNLQFCLRLGEHPRTIITTTPKPIKILRDLVTSPTTVITRGSTYANRANLAPTFLSKIVSRYEGTRIGRQELYAELLEDVEGALWQRSMFEKRGNAPADLKRVVVSVDPSASSAESAAEAGIMVTAEDSRKHFWLLADVTKRGTPNEWGRRAVQAYIQYHADRIVAEGNQGGEMVRMVIETVARDMGLPHIPVTIVTAHRGKYARAEPVAALYEQGRVTHVSGFILEGKPGNFNELEDQLTTWTPEEPESPDRLDALVWGLTALAFPNDPWAGFFDPPAPKRS